MSLKPSQVRRRVAASLADQLGAAWRETSHAFDSFPGLDSYELLDGAYAVGLGATRPAPTDRRQRRTRGLLVVTEVRIRFTSTTRPAAQPADYDAALDREHRVIWAALAVAKDPDLEIVFDAVQSRAVVMQGTIYLAELRFSVRHLMDLA